MIPIHILIAFTLGLACSSKKNPPKTDRTQSPNETEERMETQNWRDLIGRDDSDKGGNSGRGRVTSTVRVDEKLGNRVTTQNDDRKTSPTVQQKGGGKIPPTTQQKGGGKIPPTVQQKGGGKIPPTVQQKGGGKIPPTVQQKGGGKPPAPVVKNTGPPLVILRFVQSEEGKLHPQLVFDPSDLSRIKALELRHYRTKLKLTDSSFTSKSIPIGGIELRIDVTVDGLSKCSKEVEVKDVIEEYAFQLECT